MVTRQIGQRLRELRDAHALTQDEVGDRADVSGKYIGRIERGEINVTVETLDRLCTALDTNIPELLKPKTATTADDRRAVVRLVRKVAEEGDDRQVAKLKALLEIFFS